METLLTYMSLKVVSRFATDISDRYVHGGSPVLAYAITRFISTITHHHSLLSEHSRSQPICVPQLPCRPMPHMYPVGPSPNDFANLLVKGPWMSACQPE